MLEGVAGLLSVWCAACQLADRQPTRPLMPPPDAFVNQQVADGCTRFALKVVNGVALVEALYNTNGCQTDQLQLMADSAPTFNASTGVLRVPVVMKNIGTVAVVAPARIRFNADSSQFLNSQGQVVAGLPDVVATNYDTSSAGGRNGQWRYDTLLAAGGQLQVLQPGSISQRHWLQFSGTTWSQTIRIKLPTMATAASAVPAIAPDTVPSTLLVSLPTITDAANRVIRTQMIVIRFRAGATVSQRSAVVASVGGQVVGGIRWYYGEGSYYVRVPSATTEASLLTLVASLRQLADVEEARVLVYSSEPLESYLRPNDGGVFTPFYWTPLRSQASGNNWAFEAIDAPLAWGCETGSPTVVASVLDRGFTSTPELNPSFFGEPFPATGPILDHGTNVSSIMGAVGNNNTGIAGIAWRRTLDLRNRLVRPPDYSQLYTPPLGDTIPTDDLLRENIVAAGLAGVAVINISNNLQWRQRGILSPDPSNPAHADAVRNKDDVIRSALAQLHASGAFPLVVISAGNDSIDAAMAGFVGARSTYPDDILVVGGITQTRAFWPMSSRGSFVDIVAPAQLVGAVDYAGNVTLETGTSFAAPLAAGVAVLLKSFDPRLTATEIRSLIRAGAQDSVWDGTGFRRVLSAYGALRAAARRPGTPICGNRVFVRNDSVYAQRDSVVSSTSDEFLGVMTPANPNLVVEHGGRRITTFNWSNPGTRSLVYSPSGWTSRPDSIPMPNSGFARSTAAFSHEGDSAVAISWTNVNPPGNPNITESFAIADNQLTPISQPLSVVGGGPVAFDPTAPRLYVTGNFGQIWKLDFIANSVTAVRSVPPGESPWSNGVAEDGSELVSLTYDQASYQGQCYIRWISLLPGNFGALNREVTVPKNPSNGNCASDGAIGPRIARKFP